MTCCLHSSHCQYRTQRENSGSHLFFIFLITLLTTLFSTLLFAGEPYIDQVLDTSDYAPPLNLEGSIDTNIRQGRQLLGTEISFYRESGTAKSTGWEQGIGISWSQETLNRGIISLEASTRYQDSALRDGQTPTRESVIFRQDLLPLAAGLTANLAAGDLLARSGSLLANSYRLKLPSSLVRGVSTTLNSESSKLTLTSGRIGNFNGIQSRGFKSRKGTLSGVDYQQTLSEKLRFEVGLWHLEGTEQVENHNAMAGAIEFNNPALNRSHQIHFLSDDQGNLGSWLDGEQQRGRWHHRYGIFWLEPGLLWTDQQVGADRQGGYWQSNYRSFRQFLSLGWDFSQNNLEHDELLTGSKNHNIFARYSYQKRRHLSIGGLVSANFQEFSEAGDGYRDLYILEGFTRYRWQLGTANFRIKQSQLRTDKGSTTSYQYTWDQQWPKIGQHQLRTTLSANDQEELDNQQDSVNWGLLYHRPIGEKLRFNADLILGRAQADNSDDLRTIDANIGLLWQLSTALTVNANLTWSRNRNRPTLATTTQVDQRQIFLTLQYSGTRGSAPIVIGKNQGIAGSGRIQGRVFFDDNRDGIRSPGEQSLANVQIILDGRSRRVTNQNGEFDFWPVHSGKHQLEIAEELLPLPWVISEQVDLHLQVHVRRETVIDIPLVTITE